MPKQLPAIVLALLLVSSGCSTVSGSGNVVTETRQVSGFNRIDLAGSGEVTIQQGDAESLTIEADDNVLPRLTSEVSNSTLKLDRSRESPSPSRTRSAIG